MYTFHYTDHSVTMLIVMYFPCYGSPGYNIDSNVDFPYYGSPCYNVDSIMYTFNTTDHFGYNVDSNVDFPYYGSPG